MRHALFGNRALIAAYQRALAPYYEDRMGCDVCPNAHTLTLKFHRFLSEVEWRAVMTVVRTIPEVVEAEANAVIETADELARRKVDDGEAP